MIIEIVLIILGVLTFGLGIWNLMISAYIWGSLFLIGGLWSFALGVYYLIQDRKAKKAAKIEEEQSFMDVEITPDINAPILDEPIISSEDVPIEDKTQEELNEFNKAVSFTNDVIPESSINTQSLDEIEVDLTPKSNEVDRNVEVIQDLVVVEDEPEQTVESVDEEDINLDDEEIKDSDVKFEN